jgi:hypothetical protein
MKRFLVTIAALICALTVAPSGQAPAPVTPAAQAPAPPAPPSPSGPQRPAFRAGVDIVSLNVTVTDTSNHYVTDSRPGRLFGFEDGAKQEVTFFTPATAAHRALVAARQQREHGGQAADAADGCGEFRPQAEADRHRAGHRLRQPRRVRQGFTGNQAELEAAIQQTTAGGSTSLHNAIYIALKELRKIRAVSEEEVRRQALVVFSDGEDTSSLVSFEEVLDPRQAIGNAIYTIALRGPDTQTKGFHEAEYVMRTLAQETGGRPFFPARIDDLIRRVRADRRRAREPVHARLHLEEPAPRRRLAPRRRAGRALRSGPARQEGVLRPDVPLNLLPLVLYAAAGVAYAIHFARRQPTMGRAATTLLLFGALAHTFVIGMQTMEVRFNPVASTSRAVSTFVWLLTLSYLYLELTTDERAMGVFILPGSSRCR